MLVYTLTMSNMVQARVNKYIRNMQVYTAFNPGGKCIEKSLRFLHLRIS
jgi:hypothetical protein